jgi:hypothetical protein
MEYQLAYSSCLPAGVAALKSHPRFDVVEATFGPPVP